MSGGEVLVLRFTSADLATAAMAFGSMPTGQIQISVKWSWNSTPAGGKGGGGSGGGWRVVTLFFWTETTAQRSDRGKGVWYY